MILITVPHAGPGEGQDEGAVVFLDKLESVLEYENVPYKTMEGMQPRAMMDLNRVDAKDSLYVQEFLANLKTTHVHYDIHSFPDIPGETSHGYSLADWGEADIVLFNVPEITDEQLLTRLVERLEEREHQVVVQEAGFENYLTNAANVLFDVPSVLIEMNEGAGQSFDSLAQALVEVAMEYSLGTVADDSIQF